MSQTNDLLSTFKQVCQQYAAVPAVYDMAHHQSFQTLDQESDQLAANWQAHGISKGERIALYSINTLEFVTAYLAIVKTGAIVVPINVLLTAPEIQYIINNCQAKALIYHQVFAPTVALFRQQTPTLHLFSQIGGQTEKQTGSDTADIAFSDWLLPQDNVYTPPPLSADDTVVILYTSGTTGKPKGAMLTHQNLTSNCRSVAQVLGLKPKVDRFLVVLPLFHAFAATGGMLTPLLHGCSFVIVPKFDLELVASTISQTQATIFLGVPSMYNMMLGMSDEQVQRLSSLNYCISGGAALPQEIMQKFETKFGIPIYEGDGPTECSPVTCLNPVGGQRKIASVGLPIPGVEMQIMDEQGQQLPDHSHGEIGVRGPNVMKGYWDRPQDTQAAFFGQWFRTGDVGYRDEAGYFYIVDRIKDMIIVNGMNVYPRIVEEILYQMPAINEAAVVGEPDAQRGEIVVAFVVLQPNQPCTADDIITFCQTRLGRHQHPRKILFLDVLPKNATGKILKRELRRHGEIERGIDHLATVT